MPTVTGGKNLQFFSWRLLKKLPFLRAFAMRPEFFSERDDFQIIYMLVI